MAWSVALAMSFAVPVYIQLTWDLILQEYAQSFDIVMFLGENLHTGFYTSNL